MILFEGGLALVIKGFHNQVNSIEVDVLVVGQAYLVIVFAEDWIFGCLWWGKRILVLVIKLLIFVMLVIVLEVFFINNNFFLCSNSLNIPGHEQIITKRIIILLKLLYIQYKRRRLPDTPNTKLFIFSQPPQELKLISLDWAIVSFCILLEVFGVLVYS